MKVYVVYVIDDYATAVFMTTNKRKAKEEKKAVADRTGHRAWIEEYDFANQDNFDLECG